MKNTAETHVYVVQAATIFIATIACLIPALSHAQTTAIWPTKPITLVVTYPPAGGADTMARLIAPKLSEALGQPVVMGRRKDSFVNE